MECYSAFKKEEILSFGITRMKAKGIILSEISQTEIINSIIGELT